MRFWIFGPKPPRNADLSAYLDNALSLSERAEVEASLAEDQALRRELAQLSMVKDLVAGLSDEVPRRSFRLSEADVRVAEPRGQALTVGRFAFTAAAVAALAAGVVTYAAPSGSDITSSQLSPDAAELSDTLESTAPARGALSENSADDGAVGGAEAVPPAIGVAENAADGEAKGARVAGDDDSGADSTADEGDRTSSGWRAAQVSALAIAALALLVGFASWRKTRSEV